MFEESGRLIFFAFLKKCDAFDDERCCELRVDRARLGAFAPGLDGDAVAAMLEGFRRVCAGERGAGPIAALPRVERFHWLVAPRSAVIQTSAVHGGMCADPAAALAELFARRVA